MKIVWYSNHPAAPTGYGTQTQAVTRRLAAAGHDVSILNNYGIASGMGVTPYEDIPVWPQGVTQYSLDVVNAQAKAIFADGPGWVITLYDVWPLLEAGDPFKEFPTISWTPVDHFPITPQVLEWAKSHPTIAMAKYGAAMLQREGIASKYIPHTYEASTYSPGDRKEGRDALQVPEGAHLTVINAANIGKAPPRKAWVENLQALARFMKAHEDAYLYLHTDMSRPNGLPLEYWIKLIGFPTERIRTADPLAYRVGLTSPDVLAKIYRAADVLLAASGGEGFGIPVVESMACGTPAIVTDFSAQPELIGSTGWKVAYQLQADLGQGSFLAMPLVDSIVEQLEASYAQTPAEATARREAAAAKAAEYEADTVFNDMWLPLVTELEQTLNAEVARKNSPLVGPDGQKLNRAQRRANRGRK